MASATSIARAASAQESLLATKIIREHVLRPYEESFYSESWRDCSEIPDKSEIMPKDGESKDKDFYDEDWDAYQKEPSYSTDLPDNIVKGPWSSKEDYIAAHYKILREDAVASLRSSIQSFKKTPEMNDDRYTHIYTSIHFQGLLLSAMGPAFRIEFSHERAGKQIRWVQSSRLQQGTMVALSPECDMFRSVCKVAIVAARPIAGGLDQNPPQIDLFWGNPDDAVFDPVEPYVMIESRGGYFEASRHMLVALQKLRTESFQLSKHLVDLDPVIGIPEWLKNRRFLNLSSLVHPNAEPTIAKSQSETDEKELKLICSDVLHGFPKIHSPRMDESQMAACERMVTKKVSIVQGPPGTGKTFTSVSALRVMIENMTNNSPPIIIAAQTNHALDQLLRHILAFEPNILRLGGRFDRENTDIINRTLFMLRMTTKNIPKGNTGMKLARTMLDNRTQDIQMILAPLLTKNILCDEALLREGVITESQKASLYETGWANSDLSGDSGTGMSALASWMGSDQLIPIPRAAYINFGLPLEESDIEYEQMQQVELEGEEALGSQPTDALHGTWVSFRRALTGRSPVAVDERKVKKMLSKNKNLYNIPMGMRGPVYRYWEKQLNKKILVRLQSALKEYKTATDDIRIAKWVSSVKLIRHLGIKVIGCTTTGLSKYRGLLAALQPRILLIEEAAETLEGTVMAGMFDSLEQLILVGDHQQLRAHASIRALETEPYNLGISMFERLINNAIGYTMLKKQRRMIPDIRKLLCIEPAPFYSDLQDHPSVLDRKINRAPVPGMGGKDTYFFHHTWPEGTNSDASRHNIDEAEMIAGFYNYLVLNGTDYSKITVLTFYNGQRKAILKELKKHPTVGGNTYFNVFTVDSYQGEENDVIILSLVRSNIFFGIGFLENKNRLVVALSRARRGLYIFGNAVTLTAQETPTDGGSLGRDTLWQYLIFHMRDNGRFDMNGGLPINCSKHDKTIHIYDPSQWLGHAGGCDMKCQGVLCCGHQCPYLCHPFDHSRAVCGAACVKILKCGHGCSNSCGEKCSCLVSDCVAAELENLRLDNDSVHEDIGIQGDEIWGSPTKANSKHRGKASSILPEHTVIASQAISKDAQNVGVTLSVRAQPIVCSPVSGSPTNQAGVQRWNKWNAKTADKAASEERDRVLESTPKVEKTVYKETYRAIRVEGGVRVSDPAASKKTLLQFPTSTVPTSAVSASVSPITPITPTAPLPTCLHGPFQPANNQTESQKVVENDVTGIPRRPSEAVLFTDVPPNVPITQPSHSTIPNPPRFVELEQPIITQGSMSSALTSLIDIEIAKPTGDRFGSADDFERFVELEQPIVTQDSVSSALTSLIDIEIAKPTGDRFGSADDFDEFEKLLGFI